MAARPDAATSPADYLIRCGDSIHGHLGQGGGCGRFVARQWRMRRDGSDGRGGERGNAPLCATCAEDNPADWYYS